MNILISKPISICTSLRTSVGRARLLSAGRSLTFAQSILEKYKNLLPPDLAGAVMVYFKEHTEETEREKIRRENMNLSLRLLFVKYLAARERGSIITINNTISDYIAVQNGYVLQRVRYENPQYYHAFSVLDRSLTQAQEPEEAADAILTFLETDSRQNAGGLGTLTETVQQFLTLQASGEERAAAQTVLPFTGFTQNSSISGISGIENLVFRRTPHSEETDESVERQIAGMPISSENPPAVQQTIVQSASPMNSAGRTAPGQNAAAQIRGNSGGRISAPEKTPAAESASPMNSAGRTAPGQNAAAQTGGNSGGRISAPEKTPAAEAASPMNSAGRTAPEQNTAAQIAGTFTGNIATPEKTPAVQSASQVVSADRTVPEREEIHHIEIVPDGRNPSEKVVFRTEVTNRSATEQTVGTDYAETAVTVVQNLPVSETTEPETKTESAETYSLFQTDTVLVRNTIRSAGYAYMESVWNRVAHRRFDTETIIRTIYRNTAVHGAVSHTLSRALDILLGTASPGEEQRRILAAGTVLRRNRIGSATVSENRTVPHVTDFRSTGAVHSAEAGSIPVLSETVRSMTPAERVQTLILLYDTLHRTEKQVAETAVQYDREILYALRKDSSLQVFRNYAENIRILPPETESWKNGLSEVPVQTDTVRKETEVRSMQGDSAAEDSFFVRLGSLLLEPTVSTRDIRQDTAVWRTENVHSVLHTIKPVRAFTVLSGSRMYGAVGIYPALRSADNMIIHPVAGSQYTVFRTDSRFASADISIFPLTENTDIQYHTLPAGTELKYLTTVRESNVTKEQISQILLNNREITVETAGRETVTVRHTAEQILREYTRTLLETLPVQTAAEIRHFHSQISLQQYLHPERNSILLNRMYTVETQPLPPRTAETQILPAKQNVLREKTVSELLRENTVHNIYHILRNTTLYPVWSKEIPASVFYESETADNRPYSDRMPGRSGRTEAEPVYRTVQSKSAEPTGQTKRAKQDSLAGTADRTSMVPQHSRMPKSRITDTGTFTVSRTPTEMRLYTRSGAAYFTVGTTSRSATETGAAPMRERPAEVSRLPGASVQLTGARRMALVHPITPEVLSKRTAQSPAVAAAEVPGQEVPAVQYTGEAVLSLRSPVTRTEEAVSSGNRSGGITQEALIEEFGNLIADPHVNPGTVPGGDVSIYQERQAADIEKDVRENAQQIAANKTQIDELIKKQTILEDDMLRYKDVGRLCDEIMYKLKAQIKLEKSRYMG